MLDLVVALVFRHHFRLLCLVLALLAPCAAWAQTAPVQLSDEQMARITDAVKAAVLEELRRADQPPAAVPATNGPHAAPALAFEEGLALFLEQQQSFIASRLQRTFLAFPALAAETGSILARIDARPEGPGPAGFLARVAACLLAGFAAGFITRRVLARGAAQGGLASPGQTLSRALADAAGYCVFALVLIIAAWALFPGAEMQARVGHWILWSAVQFGLYATLCRIWFRPHDPAFRIVPLDDDDARVTMRLFLTLFGVMVLRSWISLPMADRQPQPVMAAALLLNNALFVSTFFLAALPARKAVLRWIEMTSMQARQSPLRRWCASRWLQLAGTGVLLLSATHAYGAILGRPEVAAGLTSTVRAALAMIMLCALIEYVGRRGGTELAARRAVPKLPGLVSQMLRVLILLGAAIYFIRLWFVDALGVMSEEKWGALAGYAFEPLAAIFGGYLAISYVNYLAQRCQAAAPRPAAAEEDGENSPRRDDASRLRTLIPILRISAIVIIVVMMSLLVLSHLGFNITPLLAGASVIGLAISFGSQALVKDIVSGILFLAEDSFRVGETIECGKSVGTVEGFTLRSVRLRHADGQIFTVPFGQLGEITNFSRDWSTVKFNMSLDRDVDLEDVREVTKTVAFALKSEFRERLLEPLKVQGVKDVTDTAIVVQFKFTSLPLDPGEIERVARSRLLKAFKDAGIALSRHPWLAAGVGASA